MPRKTLSDWSEEDISMHEMDLRATIAAQGPKDVLGYALQAIRTIRNEKACQDAACVEPPVDSAENMVRMDRWVGRLQDRIVKLEERFETFQKLKGVLDEMGDTVKEMAAQWTTGPGEEGRWEAHAAYHDALNKDLEGLEDRLNNTRQALLALEDAQGHLAKKVSDLEDNAHCPDKSEISREKLYDHCPGCGARWKDDIPSRSLMGGWIDRLIMRHDPSCPKTKP